MTTTLTGSAGVVDNFTNDDGDLVVDGTAAGTPPTDTETAHAFVTDRFTEGSGLSISV